MASWLVDIAESSLPWGKYDATRRLMGAAAKYVETTDYQRRVSQGRLVKAYIDWYTGRWQGLRTAAITIAGSDESELREQRRAWQLAGLLDLASGTRARAERQLRNVAAETTGLRWIEPLDLAVPAALARLYLSDGCTEKALHETGPAMETVGRKDVWLWATDVGPVHVDALVAAAKLGQAADLVSEFATGLTGRDAPAPTAALATCRAILTEAEGDRGQAAALYAEAATAWAALPRPYDELLTWERQGICLLALGEGEQALAILTDTQQRLHQLGARWDADRVAKVLRRQGIDAPRAHRRGPRGYGDHLSPRELEVAELVARGMTNKQIGEKLFVSPKTVDRHLRSAMRKLAASTRVGVAMAAAEAGLLRPRSDNTPR